MQDIIKPVTKLSIRRVNDEVGVKYSRVGPVAKGMPRATKPVYLKSPGDETMTTSTMSVWQPSCNTNLPRARTIKQWEPLV